MLRLPVIWLKIESCKGNRLFKGLKLSQSLVQEELRPVLRSKPHHDPLQAKGKYQNRLVDL